MNADLIANLNTDYKTKYGFSDPENYFHKSAKGLGHDLVEGISRHKKEPAWMRQFRHEALDIFLQKPLPKWGNQELIRSIDFDDIHYYIKPTENQAQSWDEVPENIKRTFDKLGVPGLSTSDVLRETVAAGPEVGKKAGPL